MGKLQGDLYDTTTSAFEPSLLESVTFYSGSGSVPGLSFTYIDENGQKRSSDIFGCTPPYISKTETMTLVH